MFDFAKTELINIPIDSILSNHLLEFVSPLIIETAEIVNSKKAKFKGLAFNVKNDRYINMNGSFHKYKNGGKHNYDDFDINDLLGVITDLSKKFLINPYKAILHNLEFGVNVTLPFPVESFLNAIISYKGREYKKETFNNKGHLLRFEFDQYELKIYNKGLQYGLSENILRIEIKVIKMEYFNSKTRSIGIQNFSDLLNTDKLKILSEYLLEAINDLLIYDNTINTEKIERKYDLELLLNGKNPKYWPELKGTKQSKTYYRQKASFKNLVTKLGTNNLQNQVHSLVTAKLNYITNIDSELKERINQYLSEYLNIDVPILTDSLKQKNCYSQKNDVPYLTVNVKS